MTRQQLAKQCQVFWTFSVYLFLLHGQWTVIRLARSHHIFRLYRSVSTGSAWWRIRQWDHLEVFIVFKDLCDFGSRTSSKVWKLLAVIEILDRPIAVRLADWWEGGWMQKEHSATSYEPTSLFNYLLSHDERYQTYCFAPAVSNKGSHIYSDIISISSHCLFNNLQYTSLKVRFDSLLHDFWLRLWTFVNEYKSTEIEDMK